MNKAIEYYLGLPYTIELIPEPEGGWFVGSKELPGCMTGADTRTEALAEIDQIMHEWLEIALESNIPIPEPEPDLELSGKFNLRVSKSLHRKLVDAANQNGVSLNRYCSESLAEAVGRGSRIERTNPLADVSSPFEKAIGKLCSIIESDGSVDRTNEEKFADWVKEELSDIPLALDVGDLPGARVRLEVVERLLHKFTGSSPALKLFEQLIILTRQILVTPTAHLLQPLSESSLGRVVESVNERTIVRQVKSEGLQRSLGSAERTFLKDNDLTASYRTR